MRAVLSIAVVLAAACGFGLGAGDGERRRQCEALVERVAQTALPAAPPGLELRFRAEQLHVDKWHPHSGPICYYAGLVPQGWPAADDQRSGRIDRWSRPDGTTLSYALLSASGSREQWVEDRELAPLRARGQVQHETSAGAANHEHRRLLVTREGEMSRLVVVRWSTRDDGHFYFRCEASLAPAYAPALPLFEAVCDAARVRHSEHPPW